MSQIKIVISVAVIAVIGLFLIKEDTGAQSKPNIIYILADDLGYAELGSYGQDKIRTPNLDQLAADGLKFTQHYSGSTVCAPTRSTIMEGLHTGHSYIRGNEDDGQVGVLMGNHPLGENIRTMGDMFKDAGYVTAAIGKWGLGGPVGTGHPNDHGFDLFYGYLNQRHAHNYYPSYLYRNRDLLELDNPETIDLRAKSKSTQRKDFMGNDYVPDLLLAEAKNFLNSNKDKPFFLYLPVTVPHAALQVPDDSLEGYIGAFPETHYKAGGYTSHEYPRAAHAAQVTRMDRDIGEILALVEELGLSENTIVMFSSDNGPAVEGGMDAEFFDANGDMQGVKRDLYEGGIRVPLIARWPNKIKAGTTTEHISAQWDLMETFAELTGGTANENNDGISFLPTLLDSGAQAQHEYLYWEFMERKGAQAVRMGKWKAVRNNLKAEPDTAMELYDLSVDIGETNNIADQNPDIVAKMKIAFRDRTPAIMDIWEVPPTE